jgi:hypothetical protein
MKTNYYIFYIFLINFSLYSQEEKYFNCDEIKNIIDYKIYDTLPNGKLIARFDKAETKIYKVVLSEKSFFYVTKPIMKKIKKSIMKNRCKKILIKEVDRLSNEGIKVIRY